MPAERAIALQKRSKVCVVQGASRGIGLEMTRQLLARGETVFATCRDPVKARELAALGGKLTVLRLDVTDITSIAAAAAKVEAAATSGAGPRGAVDLLLNTAGVLQDEPLGIVAERSVLRLDHKGALNAFAVNALGPLMMLKHFAPLLRRAAAASSKEERRPGDPGAIAIFYSARVGSIGDNSIGGWYSYRGSKAAMNQFVRCAAIELRKHDVCCLSLHPGTVDTDLTRAFLKARAKYNVQDVQDAVRNHLEIVDSLTMRDSGSFVDWQRKAIPW